MKKIAPIALAITTVFFAACKNEDSPQPIVTPAAKGAYVLSEGASFSGIASKLGKYDIATQNFDGSYFEQQNNNSPLGMNANDMVQYGSKIYIVANESNNVTVVRASDATLVGRIDFSNSLHGKKPRFAVAVNGKIYVSCTEGNKVAIIDTTSLHITGSIAVGSNPEQIAVSGSNLYVANSGGFNFPNYDSTVSVIDLSNNTEIHKIKVGINPGYVAADGDGNVYVGCFGNFSTISPKIVKLNTLNFSVAIQKDSAAGRMVVSGNYIYVATGYAGGNKVVVYDKHNLNVVKANFVSDGTSISSPYGIAVDEGKDNVWITDAADFSTSGKVFIFNKLGVLQHSFSTTPGVNPNSILFIR